MSKKKHQHMLTLRCNKCDATWSDPMRAIGALEEWMASIPAFRHNVSQNKWEEELSEFVNDKNNYYARMTERGLDDDKLKDFIRQLLAQKDHDHEILVNTIIETKNKEIANLKE